MRISTDIFWSFDAQSACLTISGKGAMTDYRSETEVPWKECLAYVRKVVVKGNVCTIGNYAFYQAPRLCETLLEGMVERIGIYSFACCDALERIKLPEGVKVIGARAFWSCSALREVYLPISLTNIDMRAFGKDVALERVYYAGTLIRWKQILISMAATDNKYLLGAKLHCMGEKSVPDKIYDDLESDSKENEYIQYLVEHGFLDSKQRYFEPHRSADSTFVTDILYRRAGCPGMYADNEDWAEENGLLDGRMDRLTVYDLAQILYRLVRKNGYCLPDVVDVVKWCWKSGYLDMFPDKERVGEKELTKEQAAGILARYLKSKVSYANRYEEMVAGVRKALQMGGDGKLYILAPNLTEPGITAKSGDCTILLFPNGQTMMIDAGFTACSQHVISLLKDIGLVYLDYFVLSHSHDDHAGGTLAVAQYLYSQANGGIGHYFRTAHVSSSRVEPLFCEYLKQKGAAVTADVTAQKRWKIGEVIIDIYNPTAEMVEKCSGAEEELNNLSILMKFTYGTSTYLTSGDLYQSMEEKLVDQYGEKLHADIMKANHHGTHTSSCEKWLAAVEPQVILALADDIGCTPLAERNVTMGIAYYSVGIDGLVMIRMDRDRNYTVTTQRDSGIRKKYRKRT